MKTNALCVAIACCGLATTSIGQELNFSLQFNADPNRLACRDTKPMEQPAVNSLAVLPGPGSVNQFKNYLVERMVEGESSAVYGLDYFGNANFEQTKSKKEIKALCLDTTAFWAEDPNTGDFVEQQTVQEITPESVGEVSVYQQLFYNRPKQELVTETSVAGIGVTAARIDGTTWYKPIAYQTVNRSQKAPPQSAAEAEANSPLHSADVTWGQQMQLNLQADANNNWNITSGMKSQSLKRIYNQSLVDQLIGDIRNGSLKAFADEKSDMALSAKEVDAALTETIRIYFEHPDTGEMNEGMEHAAVAGKEAPAWVRLHQQWSFDPETGILDCKTIGAYIMAESYENYGEDPPRLRTCCYVRFK